MASPENWFKALDLMRQLQLQQLLPAVITYGASVPGATSNGHGAMLDAFAAAFLHAAFILQGCEVI